MFGPEPVVEIGALCFGVAVGYLTYRTLVRVGDKAAISDLAAVLGAVGGGVVIKLFQPGSQSFGWYAIGLLTGMAVFFLLYGIMNGWSKARSEGNAPLSLRMIMSGQTITHGGGREGGGTGPNAPTAR
jgi:hypothetical protein